MKTIAICLVALLGLVAAEAAIAGNYEILYDTRNGDGWFGGDNRAVSNPRSAGGGQSVLVDTDILLESFSFFFVWWFDYRDNPDGAGHAVTLTLHVRDSAGTVLETATVDVAESFNSGWITWTGIDLDVTAGTTLIFTACLNGAYDANQYTNFQGTDVNGGYADGQRYTKNGTDDASMALWGGWTASSWDSMFWLQGSTPVPVETTSWGAIKALYGDR